MDVVDRAAQTSTRNVSMHAPYLTSREHSVVCVIGILDHATAFAATADNLMTVHGAVGKFHALWVSPWLVLALLGLSLFLNVFLAAKLSRKRVIIFSGGSTLKTGTTLPALRAERVGGVSTTIEWSDTQNANATILYVFSPTCVWCSRNLANIQALSGALRYNYRVIGLSLSDVGLKEYLRDHPLGFPVFTNAVRVDGKALGIAGTPETFVIARDGRIENIWNGAIEAT